MNINSRHSLAILAVLLALPVQAQTPEPRPQGGPAKPVAPVKPGAPAAQPRTEAALEAVRTKVLAGDADRAAYEELVAAIRGSYGNLGQSTPDAITVRSRLVAAVDDIYARAKQAKIAPEEFSALKVDLLDAQLEDTLAGMATTPGEKGVDALAAGVKQVADASQELDPGTAEWRTRAQALIDGLKKKATPEPVDLEPLREELAHARAMRSEVVLEKRATSKGATQTDFTRARNHLSDLLELQARNDPEARELQKKLVSAIDDLEHRAAEAALTKADFESLRKELVQRGRMALAERSKPHG